MEFIESNILVLFKDFGIFGTPFLTEINLQGVLIGIGKCFTF